MDTKLYPEPREEVLEQARSVGVEIAVSWYRGGC